MSEQQTPPDATASRFAGTAAWYARYRRGYPSAFIEHLVARFGLDGHGRLLDLGCGTGQLALPLAGHMAEVIGLDPEPEMLVEAQRQAALVGVDNARWLLGSSDDLTRQPLRGDLAPLRLVTIGRAFHWMAGDATLRALDELVEPGGGLVIVSDSEPIWGGERDWQLATRALVRRWLGEPRRAGDALFSAPAEPWEVTLARSAFGRLQRYELRWTHSWSASELLGYLSSTSYCACRLLGQRRPAFERELRAELAALAPHGQFEEDVTLEAFCAERE